VSYFMAVPDFQTLIFPIPREFARSDDVHKDFLGHL
jgi:hypothetical protein